jgi:hypothetical protein
MKKFICFLPFVLTLATGCFNNQGATPTPEPSGTYSGEFRHISKKANKLDTLKCNIKLVLEPGIGFHVLGDTTKVHAGSKGNYGINGDFAAFVDATYPKTGKPAKSHLNGEYGIVYDGSIFQLARTEGDTVSFQYELKKTN